MKVAIRVDASQSIGSGHVMRTLTLAEVLRREHQAEVHFILRPLQGDRIEQVKQAGFPIRTLEPPTEATRKKIRSLVAHSHWLEVDWEQDAQETEKVLGNDPWDWLIVDHYALEAQWHRMIRSKVKRIFAIDDIADRALDCDLLLDQNRWEAEQHYEKQIPKDTPILAGPKYALLRPEFQATPKPKRNYQNPTILVSFGGVDQAHQGIRVVNLLQKHFQRWNQIHYITGDCGPKPTPHPKIQTYSYVPSLAQLMETCDLAIGAGGSMTWERCARALPTFILTLAQNQLPVAQSAAQAHLAYNAGPHDTQTDSQVEEKLHDFLTDTARLSNIATQCQKQIDGKGAERVAQALHQR